MKIKRNRKADSSIWGIVLAVAGILIFAAIAIPFTGGLAAVSTGTIAKSQCKATLEAKNKYNQKVDETKEEVKEKAAHCDWFTRDAGDACWAVGGIRWLGMNVFGGNDLVDAGAHMFKIKTDFCIENFPDECPIVIGKPASADLAAECVYRRAVDTFYTLQGGKGPNFEKRTIDGRKFNLFKLNVTVEEPGSVLVRGSCSTYLKDAAIWTQAELQAANLKDCDAVIATGQYYVCGYQQEPQICNITFSRVTEDTMTLTMVSRAQQYGPDNTRYSKCFAIPDVGYSTFNGLPNSMTSNKDTSNFKKFEEDIVGAADYTTLIDGTSNSEYSSYRGCGVREGLKEIIIDRATIMPDNIVAKDLDVNLGEEKTYYLRLQKVIWVGGGNAKDLSAVVVSSNEQQ